MSQIGALKRRFEALNVPNPLCRALSCWESNGYGMLALLEKWHAEGVARAKARRDAWHLKHEEGR